MYNYLIRLVPNKGYKPTLEAIMAKWNPASNVNAQHLLNIVRQNNPAYLQFVSDITTCAAANEVTPEIVQEGCDRGYLPSDAKAILFPSSVNVKEATAAAAADANGALIESLLQAGQTAAVDGLIKGGLVTEEFVAGIMASLACLDDTE